LIGELDGRSVESIPLELPGDVERFAHPGGALAKAGGEAVALAEVGQVALVGGAAKAVPLAQGCGQLTLHDEA